MTIRNLCSNLEHMPTNSRHSASSEPTSIQSKRSINYTPFLMVALIVGAYFLGVYITKAQYLEQERNTQAVAGTTVQGTGTAPPAPSITNDDIKTWSKEIGLDTNKFNSCFDAQRYKNLVDTDTTEGQTAGVSGTPTFYINGTQLVGAQPFAAFKDVIDKELNGTAETTGKVTIDNGHLPMLGKTGAAVTIVEFSDFECPYCRRFYQDAYKQLKKEYVDSGKTVFYYRHFPLNFHPLALPFAIASECANEQGKFWEMHNKIFEEQG